MGPAASRIATYTPHSPAASRFCVAPRERSLDLQIRSAKRFKFTARKNGWADRVMRSIAKVSVWSSTAKMCFLAMEPSTASIPTAARCFAVGRECSACVGAEGASGVAGWRHRWTASAVAVPARGAAGARCADTASAPTAPAVGPWAAPGRGHSTLCQISLALALGDDAVGRCPRMARRVSAPNESGTPGGAHPEHRSTAMIAVVPLEFSVP